MRGRQRTFDNLAENFLIDKYDPPNFALRLALKDVTLAAELGQEADVPMPLIEMARSDLAEAVTRGWGERDSRAFMLLQQERAGVHIAVDPAQVQAVLEAD